MGHALDYLKDELVELETSGLLLHPRTMEGPTGARATFDGRSVINLASNNYLGLSNHPRMNRAAADAAERFGAGTGAVRTIAGQMRMHLDLEDRFAAFKHADAALLFQSGFTANAGTVAAILGPDDVIVSDRLNHASIIDGGRLSKAEIKVFEHRDAADAERRDVAVHREDAVGDQQLTPAGLRRLRQEALGIRGVPVLEHLDLGLR
jgi:glycine C-acetyltransferase